MTLNSKWYKAKNVAETPNNDFVMNDLDWIKFQLLGSPSAIVHSHPRSGANLSEFDRVQQARFKIPFIIVSLRDWNVEIYS